MVFKKRYRKRRPTVRSLAKKVAKIQQDTELKEAHPEEYTYNGSLLTTTLREGYPTLRLLNGLTQGTTKSTRIGDKVRSTSVHITGRIYTTTWTYNEGFIPNNNKVRVIIFNLKRPRGTSPASNLFRTQTAGSPFCPLIRCGTTDKPEIYSTYNTIDNMYEHYDVLADKTYSLRQNSIAGQSFGGATTEYYQSIPQCVYNIRRKVKRVIDYSIGNSGDITDINMNAIYAVFFTDWPADESGLTIEMDAKFFYKDE